MSTATRFHLKSTHAAGRRAARAVFALAVAPLALACAVSAPVDHAAPAVTAVPASPAAAKEPPACSSPMDRQVEAWLSA